MTDRRARPPASATPARRRGGRRPSGPPGTTARPHDRFLALGRDRALREWSRYEGTPQRELFRVLRERFLARHATAGRWSLDVGSGPGRFLPFLGGPGTTRVALDLSREMLRVGRDLAAVPVPDGPGRVERVRGDALRSPFGPASFDEIALVGNALGFEESAGVELLEGVEQLVRPGGVLVLEIAPGPGERSRYLARLPLGAVRRLLAAPPAAVLPRLNREGFAAETPRHRPAAFRRWTAQEITHRWRREGWLVREVMAVGPALGADPEGLAAVAKEARAWARLLELEERLGREPPRWLTAAAVLLAAERPATPGSQAKRL